MIRMFRLSLALVLTGIIATSLSFAGQKYGPASSAGNWSGPGDRNPSGVPPVQKHWIGSTTGNWSGPNDWNPTGVPAAADIVILDSQGTGPCYVDGDYTCGNVTVNSNFGSYFEIGNGCSLTVTGDFIQLGSSFFFQGASGGTLTVGNNLKRTGGTFNTTFSTIQMSGAGTDTIQGITSFNNLTFIGNSYYRMLASSTVGGLLNLNGVVQMGNDTLTVVSIGTANGFIDGAFSHTFNSAGSMNYSIGSVSGHTGSGRVTVAVASGTFPVTLVLQTNSSNNPPVVDINKCVDRKWIFNTTSGFIASCDLTFDYANTTISGTEASYVLAKHNGTAYVVQASNAPNTTTHTISINGVSGPSSTWTIGQAAALPIVMSSFTASAAEGHTVRIDWSTATETNTYGFVLQRRREGTSLFVDASGFIASAGNSLEEQHYSFTDQVTEPGTYFYRVRQSDLDGAVSYSSEISIVVAAVLDVNNAGSELLQFRLLDNYPNPFNPSTSISYTLKEDSYVTVAIYNVLGELVATPVHERQSTGLHSVQFDASQLSSGVYYYSIRAGAFSAMKKMILAR